MVEYVASLLTYEELAQFVARTLSQFETLESECYQLSQHILTRGDRPCGVYFCLHGPRAVRLSAIWETDRNTVLYYGSSGRRLGRTSLIAAPPLPGRLAGAASAA